MITTIKQDSLNRSIKKVINELGIDNELNIPDWELAGILTAVLCAIPARPSPPQPPIL